jgi:CRP/FNR family transcriptional regulator, anaerobic regulatory protein
MQGAVYQGLAYAPAASEDLLAGAQILRRAFLEAPSLSANRDAVIIRADARDPPCVLINRGVVYGSSFLSDGQRSISDIMLPGDIVGVDHAVLGHANREIIAASPLGYRVLEGAVIREMMRDHRVALRMLAVAGENRLRTERHITALTRLDARGRIARMILEIYERLRRRELILRATFNLPLTQDQIADHLGITMVHVSRTLRRLREERVVLVDRHVVIILDLDKLRLAADGPASREKEALSESPDQRPSAQPADAHD